MSQEVQRVDNASREALSSTRAQGSISVPCTEDVVRYPALITIPSDGASLVEKWWLIGRGWGLKKIKTPDHLPPQTPVMQFSTTKILGERTGSNQDLLKGRNY